MIATSGLLVRYPVQLRYREYYIYSIAGLLIFYKINDFRATQRNKRFILVRGIRHRNKTQCLMKATNAGLRAGILLMHMSTKKTPRN